MTFGALKVLCLSSAGMDTRWRDCLVAICLNGLSLACENSLMVKQWSNHAGERIPTLYHLSQQENTEVSTSISFNI